MKSHPTKLQGATTRLNQVYGSESELTREFETKQTKEYRSTLEAMREVPIGLLSVPIDTSPKTKVSSHFMRS